MNFISLEIDNFLAVGHAKLSLDERGLVLIQGDNQDDPSAISNGAGKSTIADALCWGLFGRTAKNVSGDSIINREARGQVRVAIVVDDGHTSYLIERHRKHKKGKNALWVHDIGENPKDMTLGTDRLTQVVVEQILGCNYDVFAAAIYAGQEAMPDLPSMTDKELKAIVEQSAGLTVLERAYAGALVQKQATFVDYEEAKQKVNSEATAVEESQERLSRLDEDEKDWKAKLRNNYAGMELEVDSLNDDMTEARKRLSDMPTASETDAKLAELEADLQKNKVDDEHQHKLEKDAIVAEKIAEGIANDIGKQQNKVRALKLEQTQVAERVGSPCNECGRPLTENEIEVVFKTVTDNLYLEAIALRSLNDRHERAAADSVVASKRARDFKASRTSVDEVIASERILRTTRQETVDTEESIKRMSREVQTKQDQMKALLAEKSPYTAVRERTQKELERATESVKTSTVRMNEAQQEHLIALQSCEVFSPGGVRASIIDTVTPYLNKQTGKYLALLSDGSLSAIWHTIAYTKSGEAREKFNIEVTNTTGADSFQGLSGGEKRKVRLACALALQDLVATRATKPINLWIGDEVDHALDAAGLERLMILLEDKARERGTVLVISHNELGAWIRNTVTVSKKGGVATATGCLVETS